MRILFISHFIPHPPTGGASLRNYNIVKELSRKNTVHLVTFTQRDRHPTRERIEKSREVLKDFCEEISIVDVPSDFSSLKWYSLLGFNLFSREPYSAWRFWAPQMAQAITDQISRHHFDIVHVDTIALAGYLKYLQGLPAVLNHHNVESTLLLRRAATEKNPATSAYINLQGRKLRRAEQRALGEFDGNISVSELDSQELQALNPAATIRVVPNGTDTDYFKPIDGVKEDASLVFAGSMAWYPNGDAMILFGEKIWPLIKKEIPDITMNLIGSRAPAEVVKYGENDGHFKVLGFVDDVRPTIARAAVYVVPIRVGGGTRLKILDAMAMGKAIVSHPIGAEGLDVTDGKDIVIAEEPELFAKRVVELVRDERKRRSISHQARKTVVEKYSWSTIIPNMEEFYREISQRKRANSGGMNG